MAANIRAVARGATREMIENLKGRAGVGNAIDEIETATMDEIFDELRDIVESAIRECL